jgi:beta-lactamase class A
MFTYFKLAESDPKMLEKELEFDASNTVLVSQTKPLKNQLEVGKRYTIDDLIFRTAAFSDNDANLLLLRYLKEVSPGKNLLTETLAELGVITLMGDINTEALSAKTNASFYRLLYNVSYLSKEFSEKSLDYLAQSSYEEGIKGGLPPTILVAHKFGERHIQDDSVQLHDCGIIYYPNNPYLLCIMTKGDSFDELAAVIRSISNEVWKEVNSRKL